MKLTSQMEPTSQMELTSQMEPISQMEPPKTPIKQSDLPRDIRLQARTLREIGWKYSKIAEFLKITLHQVQYACALIDEMHRCEAVIIAEGRHTKY